MILRRLVSLILDGAWPRAHATAAAHAAAVRAGHAADVFLSNHLIVSYSRSGLLAAALNVFDEMPRRNLVSWSALISCCAHAGRPELALELFARMGDAARPNEHVYTSVACSCAALRALAAGEQVHAHAVKSGFLGSSFVSNSIVSMYMKCGCFDEGYGVFRTLAEPTVVSYNAVISGVAASSRPEKGLEVFRLMKLRGLRPDRFSYAAVLGICSDLGDPNIGAALHSEAVKTGVNATAFVGNVMLDMYSKHGTITEAEQVFLSVEEKDAVTWNTYIAAHSRRGGHMEALMLFKDMLDTNVCPDNFTYANALEACAELSLIHHGGQVHCHLIRSREDTDVAVGNAVISMYARCGHMVFAVRAFDQLRARNSCSWNTLISGFSKQGHGKEAIGAFERMKEAVFAPDSITFTGLLAACNHAGLVNQGMEYFNSMSGTYGVSPRAEHVSCVIDILGRAGRLKEAEDHVLASAFRDDPVVLGSLLSASRVHGDAGVGGRAAGRLLALGPATTSPYVLLSHLHASGGRWDGAAEARRMLKDGAGAARTKDAGLSVVGFR
ncbi:Pentatricopeptide repeat-containing protein [Dichanthelium oligosanthes]|uniref:Pentatricopeptide repeat-containing protein n=1 Tax=Dichanthelium oligosanthes TaxID=888268 RepID=A0A1E5URJ4_9POAL|nr:Pentatricopeptide repeat-containing protein [Dichanthelium oligosanthes]